MHRRAKKSPPLRVGIRDCKLLCDEYDGGNGDTVAVLHILSEVNNAVVVGVELDGHIAGNIPEACSIGHGSLTNDLCIGLMGSKDFQNAVKSFMKKEKPVFKGE